MRKAVVQAALNRLRDVCINHNSTLAERDAALREAVAVMAQGNGRKQRRPKSKIRVRASK